MHRVRTWARAKAHGPSPLVSGPRRLSSTRNGPANGTSPAPAWATGTGPAAGVSKLDQSNEPLPTITEEKPSERKSVFVRFFVVLKDILFSSIINILLVFVPVGIAVRFAHMPAGVVFGMNAIAIIPLAGLLSHATESVASRLGDTIGALMNVTFGNAVELIIFVIALVKNEIRIVQASLLGSILANLLLILGMCFLFGGLRFREQIYNSTVTQMSACLLSLSVTSLLLPTAFHASFSDAATADDRVLQVSRGTSVILLLVYGLYLLFQLNSHSYMYESTPQHIIERESAPGPAAQYFNSSSSSDTSSSSSDTDGSTQSVSTAKKIKRMVKGKRSRRQSVASQQQEAQATSSGIAEGTAAASSTSNGSRGVASVDNADIIAPAGTAAVDDAMEEADEMAADDQPKKHRRKHKHQHRKHRKASAGGNLDGAELEQTHSAPVQEPRRVDFALGPNLEAQQPQAQPVRPKPFSLRSLRSPIPNVFAAPPIHPTAADPPTFSLQQRPLRRAHSMPAARGVQPNYRAPPGSVPPIVPIVVNSTPKPASPEDDDGPGKHQISRTTAVVLLLVSTGLVALCAEFMVDSISEVVADGSGVSEAFIGLILLPIVGNAAEHVTAVTVALKNKMDLAIGVALGSSIQIAIFVTPLVVILGWIMNKPMSLFFTLFETVSMFVSAFIVNFLVLDGRSNYLEGALLCSAYVIIAVAAFFYPNAEAANSLGGGSGNSSTATEAVMVHARVIVRGMADLVGMV
ncbi:vacuolar calcium ion transporter [Diplogelasinospora grovesii]|uniref:Vacuolar calcium ion transporter n=1 Tax=Diplogelasinospora grovesii TaxID=303347 RepID=A0AAN6S102_9PEZI|nr:vacuolar calcium ion transporter [Diplogelasinospora grovesii]